MSARSGTEVPLQGNPRALAADAEAFGEFLRASRQHAGISLDQITTETKIPQRHFEALEHGNVRTWPRGMYTRAMLRAYAESVGLDREYVAAQFERVFDQKPAGTPVAAPPEPAADAPVAAAAARVSIRRTRRMAPLAAVAVAAVGILAVGGVFASRDAAVATTVQPANAAPRTGSDIPLQVTVPAAPVHEEARPVSPPSRAPEPSRLAETARTARTTRAAAGEPELIVTSDPPGARVMVNDVGWGSTPARIKFLPFGPKRIRVTKDGYVSAERSVTLAPDAGPVKVELKLQSRE